MCAGDLEVWLQLVDRTVQLESSGCVLFKISEGSSALDHIKPISNEFGIRGRMPRYRFGRYGPHSNDALLDVDRSSRVVGNASIKVQNMSRMSGNMVKCSVPCVVESSTTGDARDSNDFHLIFRTTPLHGGDICKV